MVRSLQDTAAAIAVAAGLTGCPSVGDSNSSDAHQVVPRPRPEDPPLTHTWRVPPASSRITRGDMGSEPPELADALMAEGTMPSLVHRLAAACTADKALGAAGAEIVLRVVVVEGKLSSVEASPKGSPADCLRTKLGSETSAFADLPNGLGLIRLEISKSET